MGYSCNRTENVSNDLGYASRNLREDNVAGEAVAGLEGSHVC